MRRWAEPENARHSRPAPNCTGWNGTERMVTVRSMELRQGCRAALPTGRAQAIPVFGPWRRLALTVSQHAAMQALVLLIFLLSTWAGVAQAQVYRCGNTYSNAACANGCSVDVTPPVSDPAGPRTVLIYLCQYPSHRRAWHAEPCSHAGLVLERTERVPSDLDWPQQVAFANALRAQAQTQAQSQAAANAAPARSGPFDGPSRQQQCKALEERVRELDSMGRAGSRYYDLDWVRSERKKARDAQFRLQCR